MSLWNRQQGIAPIAIASIAGLFALTAVRSILSSSKPRQLKAPQPTESEPYPWNIYEGGATLQTPYGNIRLYELGPKEGKKVLLIHGISQPCPLWRLLIPKLIESGHHILCYVSIEDAAEGSMVVSCGSLFGVQDLVGRGYSDGPGHLTYDLSLYVSQLCMLLTSLPEWSGSFNVVGYSLGGAIATTFARYFPHRIDNLLLIAPAGLIDVKSLPTTTRLLCSGQVPHSIAQSVLRISRAKFLVQTKVVEWQLQNHKGFMHAFTVSTAALDTTLIA
jgi:pimeloyl-ACP methyl ester carboxylesterase